MTGELNALIVEDNRQMAFLLSDILRDMGFSNVTRVDSRAAAAMAADLNAYNLALVDVGLGDGDGLDFIQSVRADRTHPARDMPFIVVSGQGGRSVIQKARDVGADWFLVKPVRTQDLVDRIRTVLARRGGAPPAAVGPNTLELD